MWCDVMPAGPATAEDVRSYCSAYARHFELLPHIRFQCKLLRLVPEVAGGHKGEQHQILPHFHTTAFPADDDLMRGWI